MISKYSQKQWLILLVYSVVNIFCALLASLQGPFYPMVAETKGATPSQYGIVFGAYSLVVFLGSLLSGVLISKFNVVKISLAGILIAGISSIMFGFVDKLHGVTLFISISVIMRGLEGFGYTIVRNSSVAIISSEFSDNIEIAFAIFQAMFSVGFVIGPVVGGSLYELGGFYLPFVVIGALLVATAYFALFLPKEYPKNETKSRKQILIMLQQPSVILSTLIIFGCCFNSSFVIAFLEPHIKRLHYSPTQVGLIFLCIGLSFSFSSIFWSIICDKYDNSLPVCAFSSFLVLCGLMILGPAPYLHFDLNLYSCIFGLIIHTTGLAGQQIGGFSTLNKSAVLAGLPQSIQTSGYVSTIYTTSLSFGLLVGPIVGGIILEAFDFPWGSHIFILYHLIILFAIIIYIHVWCRRLGHQNEEMNILNSEEISVKYESIEKN